MQGLSLQAKEQPWVHWCLRGDELQFLHVSTWQQLQTIILMQGLSPVQIEEQQPWVGWRLRSLTPVSTCDYSLHFQSLRWLSSKANKKFGTCCKGFLLESNDSGLTFRISTKQMWIGNNQLLRLYCLGRRYYSSFYTKSDCSSNLGLHFSTNFVTLLFHAKIFGICTTLITQT